MPEEHEAYEESLNPEREATPLDHLPPALRNWQVIDGEATRVEEPVAPEPPVTSPTTAIPEHADDVIVAGLDTRQLTVKPGSTATWQCSLLNNGNCTALFRVHVEGWIDESWLSLRATPTQAAATAWPLQVLLHPGERTNLAIEITPPRAPSARAGEHPLAFVVRAAEYPERFNRLTATLTIALYTDFALGQVQPKLLRVSWFKRSGTLSLPLTNRGNDKITLHLQGLPQAKRRWQLEFGSASTRHSRFTLTLQPGQQVHVPVQVKAHILPLFALRKRNTTIPIRIRGEKELHPARIINVEAICTGLIGPWHLTALFGFFMLTLLGLGLALIAGLMLWRASITQANINQPVSIQTPAILPVIALVVNLPAATPVPLAVLHAPLDQMVLTPVANGKLANVAAAREITVPLVMADQVTGPGTPAPAVYRPAPVVLVASATPAPPAVNHNITYQEMFQEIGRQHDLNWRMLAAQAYTESSFDSVAVSPKGAMGLMQILPTTWHEWAPAAKASDPMDSYSNVLVAAIYLDYLRTTLSQHGHPQAQWMLVAYNWGIDKVVRHLDSGLGWDDLPPETRQYAKDVLRIAETIPAH